jgi:hypothetical protein
MVQEMSSGPWAVALAEAGDGRAGLGEALAERVVVPDEVLDGGGERGDSLFEQADLGQASGEVVFEIGAFLLW